MVRKSDFATWTGHQVKMETSVLVADRKRFQCRITEAGENDVLIERDVPAYERGSVRVPYEAIAEARLVRRPHPRCAVEGQQGAQGSRKRRGAAADETQD